MSDAVKKTDERVKALFSSDGFLSPRNATAKEIADAIIAARAAKGFGGTFTADQRKR